MRRKLEAPPPQVDVIIDSGAYSAWRLGEPIALSEYCDFLLENLDWIHHYVSLDVIDPDDPETAAAAGYANYKYMRKRGLHPIPVYHAREDIKWLYKYLDAGADYIGISASSLPHHNSAADNWYHLVWPHLVNSDGLPIVKTHAFGEGRYSSLARFPWYSADSASWLYAAQRTGQIYLEGGRKVAFRNDGLSQAQAQDVHALLGDDKVFFDKLLQKVGMSWSAFDSREAARTCYVARTYLMAHYYLEMERKLSALCPRRYHPTGLLNSKGHLNAPGLADMQMRVYLVIGGNIAALAVLAKAKAKHALSSYAHISKMRHYRNLGEWAVDPMGTSKRYPEIRNRLEMLEGILHDEQRRVRTALETVQSADAEKRTVGNVPLVGAKPARRARRVDLRDA